MSEEEDRKKCIEETLYFKLKRKKWPKYKDIEVWYLQDIQVSLVTAIELLLHESKKQKKNEPRWAGLIETEKHVKDPGLLVRSYERFH
jgi:hypothetical protein